jgi:predicted SAM-dependent methyltransferase
MTQLICEIGVGETPAFENSVRIDIRKTPFVTVIADARYLPFKNNVFDYIFSSHTLEHFTHRNVKKVLAEWVRICIYGGVIELRCPDLRARALLFALSPSWEDIKNIYGEQNYPQNFHKCGFSFELLRELLNELGVDNVKRIRDGYKGIPFIPCDLHIIGKKSIIR